VGVISAVRAGLVVQLKESLGIQAISTKQEKICKLVIILYYLHGFLLQIT